MRIAIVLTITFLTAILSPSGTSALVRYVPILPVPRDLGAGAPPVEYRVSPDLKGRAYPRNSTYEPTVVAHPTDPNTLAVVYQGSDETMRCGLGSVIRISHDGGATWKTTKRRPGGSMNRGQNFHATIAWGPGPTEGSARLYWVNTTVPGCDYSSHSVTISWSDNEGTTWSKPFINGSTDPWIGGLPSVTADKNPASPGYGNVFVVFNHLVSAQKGSGMRLLASTDYGRSWSIGAEVPPAPLAKGCSDTWRISYKSGVGPDGILHVVGYQSDLRNWSASRPFAKGGSGNVCRQAFTTTAVLVDKANGTISLGPTVVATEVSRSPQSLSGALYPGTNSVIVDPGWAYGLSIDPISGAIYLAVGDVRPVVSQPSEALVRLGTSLDGGVTWHWQEMPPIDVAGPRSEGRGASGSFRPVVAACGSNHVVVALRAITALTTSELRASSSRPPVAISGFAFISSDGGTTWSKPLVTAKSLWSARVLGRSANGVGLSDSAACTAGGLAVFAYGDGRDGSAVGPLWGRTSIYLAVVDPGFRRPEPPVRFH
jgi:hypothetical protein